MGPIRGDFGRQRTAKQIKNPIRISNRTDNNEFKKDKVDIIIFGHSHTPENKKIDGILFFNPGSLTDKDFAPYNSYGILELNDEIEAKIIRI